MKLRFSIILFMAFCAVVAFAQTDVIGSHDLSPLGTSPIKGTVSGSCLYCHAPHSGLNGTPGVSQTPLWNQTLSSVQSYMVYTSSTMVNKGNPSPMLGSDSTLCLSCHDGTVGGSSGGLQAPGNTAAYGKIPMSGQMNAADVFGTDLTSVHPFSLVLPIQPAPSLVPSLTANPPSTADATGAVRLIKGNVECTSCHNPHVQNIDPNSPNFLVIDNSSSSLCLACHTTTPSGTGMGMTIVAAHSKVQQTASNPLALPSSPSATSALPITASTTTGKVNPLMGWLTSSHATASNRVARQISVAEIGTPNRAIATTSLGNYATVGKNGCTSCHATHKAQAGKSLLRQNDDYTCLSCHNGSSNLDPPVPNILAEMVTPKNGHAFSAGNTPHQINESALLNQNRHVTCVDCHNPHASSPVNTFTAAPAIRPSQNLVLGVSGNDGVTLLNPAVNQYENCLRCHGTSTAKGTSTAYGYLPSREVSASDPLDVIPQLNINASSSHPVMHDRSSTLPQPSLRTNMLNLDGRTDARSMRSRIFCTDCHNSDDNREFGGKGPNGPHGSIFPHVLERRYEFSQAPAPGKPITNLFPNPSLSAEGGPSGGPYALCGKCHDLANIMANTSFTEHARHLKDGFSCSVCHTAHGMPAQSGILSGERMVNFDMNVVAPNGAAPVTYSRATNSCSLTCHGHQHKSAASAVSSRGIFK